jgi:potassium-dependent mechanosensitive channel
MVSVREEGDETIPVKAYNSLTLRRGLSVMAVIAWLFLLCPFAGAQAEQKSLKQQATTAPAPTPASTSTSAPASVPEPSAPSCIAVADVAAKATGVANLLQAMTQKMAPRPQVEMIRELYSDLSKQIDQDMTGTMDVLRQQPSLSLLQAQQRRWQQMQLKTTGWLTVLTKRSNELQNELDSLADLQKTWETTLKASQDSKAPGPILQQINQTLAAIKAAEIPLQARLTIVLDLQSSVSAEVAKCGMVLSKIDQIQKTSMSGIFVRDGLPIVSPMLWAYSPSELLGRVVSIGAGYAADFSNYLQAPSGKRLLNIGLLAVLVLLFLACQREVRKWTAASETFSRDIRVFDHPIAAALSVTLLVATSPYWPLPTSVRVTFQILLFAPLLILVRPVVSTRLMPGLYMLWLLFAIDATREVFSSDQLIGQFVLVAESLFGIFAMVWFLRKLKPVYGEAAGASRLRLLQTGVVVLLLILAVGFGAAAMGYMRLARLMTPGILVGGSLALALYASVRLLIGIVAVALHVWPLRTLRLVMHNRDQLEKKLYRVLIWLAITAWGVRYLSYIGMLELALSFGQAVLAAKFERGAISISPGGALEFVFTVWAAYWLSAFIRFVLGEDVYPRMRIAAGKSYAISSLLHYFILALGFTIAIAALGVNLSKLTVLTGAFGVGIGFGLQSVINNFVSGLILLFERPIHVGDTVEVGDLLGKVRSIGIRASTVHTRQGADIIVPNSQLISDKVTNWTLSDQLRRVDLPVGVNYSAPPGEVIKMLVTVARANSNILKDPEPQGLFMGFGDSSINFELRAWTDCFDDWAGVRSELASAVYDAVHAAGMTFPFPQREVRFLREPDAGKQ